MWTPSTDRYLLIIFDSRAWEYFYAQPDTWMNFREHKADRVHWNSHLSFGRHKSQSGVSGSVVYKKTPGLFKIGKEREEKVRWQKAPRAHYELAMSDELFRDSKGPAASRFIDCSKKKSANLGLCSHCLQFVTQGEKRAKKLRLWAGTCWFTTCWGPRRTAAEGELVVGDNNGRCS